MKSLMKGMAAILTTSAASSAFADVAACSVNASSSGEWAVGLALVLGACALVVGLVKK
jgi:hypothetical protein